jgi:hypothetical protein
MYRKSRKLPNYRMEMEIMWEMVRRSSLPFAPSVPKRTYLWRRLHPCT